MTIVERDGPCSIERHNHSYVFHCSYCHHTAVRSTRRDAEDLYDRHTHQEEG